MSKGERAGVDETIKAIYFVHILHKLLSVVTTYNDV